MARARDLDAFWNWLPAFRAAAEAEHLSAAAQELGVSPSSLSRSIRLLEAALGTQLFDRAGSAFRLTAEGRAFLESLRDGMRLIHEGYQVVAENEPIGPFTISCAGSFAPQLLRILDQLGQQYPRLVPQLRSAPRPQVNDMLLLGELDAAILSRPTSHDGIHTEPLTKLTHGVYCGATHPLRSAAEVTLEQLAEYPFCATCGDTTSDDGWPSQIPRQVTLRVTQLPLLVEACAAGHHLAVIPDLALRSSHIQAGLTRLPVDTMLESELFVLRRSDLQPGMTAQIVVEAIRQGA